MINKDTLQNRIKKIDTISIRDKDEEISIRLFSGKDFDFDQEQVIFIAQGKKTDFIDPIDFWIKSVINYCLHLDLEFIEHGYLEAKLSGECQKITFRQSQKIMEEALSTLKNKHKLNMPDHFVDALLMFDDWNDKALLMEFRDEYLTFHWLTTA